MTVEAILCTPSPKNPNLCIHHQIGMDRCVDALRTALAEMTAERDRWDGYIEFLRYEWSSFGAKACPACIYENGTFVRRCRPHAEMDDQTTALAEIAGALEQIAQTQPNSDPTVWAIVMAAQTTLTTHAAAIRGAK